MVSDLHTAAVAGDRDRVIDLLASGQNADAFDRYGQTALMLAACHGQDEIVRRLIAEGVALDVTAKYGLSALMLAVVNRHPEVARQLLAAGADASIQGTGAPGFAGKTARELALDSGQEELAGELNPGTRTSRQ